MTDSAKGFLQVLEATKDTLYESLARCPTWPKGATPSQLKAMLEIMDTLDREIERAEKGEG